MELQKVYELMAREKECVLRQDNPDCNRDACGCQCCDLIADADEIIEAYNEVLKLIERQIERNKYPSELAMVMAWKRESDERQKVIDAAMEDYKKKGIIKEGD